MNSSGRTPKQQAAYEADLRRRAACSRVIAEATRGAARPNQSPRPDAHIATKGGLSGVIRPAWER